MMKRFGWKIGLIVAATLLGLACMWPPQKKLKLGIDLSGGTILVYEAENLPPGFNMDELIAALKKRADPEGVKEIPIRKIGGNRIEIILPQASNEEVEEVKKMLTDVGSLEFRILANGKHDYGRGRSGPGGRRAGQAAEGLQVGPPGGDLDGNQPRRSRATPSPTPQQSWKKDLYAGTEVALTGKDSSGSARTEVGEGAPQHRQHVDPRQAAWPEVDRVVSRRIQPQPDQGWRPQQPGPERLDRPRRKGRSGPDRDLDPLQPGQAGTGSDRKVSEASAARRGRPAPAGRPVRV